MPHGHAKPQDDRQLQDVQGVARVAEEDEDAMREEPSTSGRRVAQPVDDEAEREDGEDVEDGPVRQAREDDADRESDRQADCGEHPPGPDRSSLAVVDEESAEERADEELGRRLRGGAHREHGVDEELEEPEHADPRAQRARRPPAAQDGQHEGKEEVEERLVAQAPRREVPEDRSGLTTTARGRG